MDQTSDDIPCSLSSSEAASLTFLRIGPDPSSLIFFLPSPTSSILYAPLTMPSSTSGGFGICC